MSFAGGGSWHPQVTGDDDKTAGWNGREELVSDRSDPPWLPSGSRARIVRGGAPPQPMCLARLLLRRGGAVFCVPRTGSGKLDLPTAAVRADDLGGAFTVGRLVHAITGRRTPATYLGAVVNLVPTPGPDYPWPHPIASFGVWTSSAAPAVTGTWVDAAADDSVLRDRHWHPLVRPADQHR